MKSGIIFIGLLCMLLLIGSVSGTVDDKIYAGLQPVIHQSLPDTTPPLRSDENLSGAVIDDKIYMLLAPCYSEYLIKSYGPVPVFTKDHQVVTRGAIADYTPIERAAQFRKLDNLYEATKESFNKQYSYPHGPVITYGYNALGSVAVGIYEKDFVDQKTLDGMYSIIAAEAKKQGIDNVPVIFYTEPVPQLDLGRSDIWRPVIGGVQASSPEGYFTVGFTAIRGGQTGFVTTGHAGGVGTTIYQPGLNNPIGTLSISSQGKSSDSSWVPYSNSAGQIFESSSSQPWVYGYPDPYVGLGVTMSGVTSGVSTGTVVQKGSLYNKFFKKTLDNQWYASFSGAAGDSGAPVYYKDSNQHIQLVGIFWGQGRYSTFSPVSAVMSDLS
jgi:hypothetical protein